MSNNPTAEQPSLFPQHDTEQSVIEAGIASLPIINPNDLVTLLQVHRNTILGNAHDDDDS